jgi:regulatory protein
MTPKYSIQEAKVKLEAYCAYQERCHHEISQKLRDWGMYSEDSDALIANLIENNFLNEERFASAFVSGKFRIKRWGRIKIKQHLKQKYISNYSINKGLAEIDATDYLKTLDELAVSKNALTKAKNKWDRLAKMQRYLQSKGYESDLIRETLKHVLDGEELDD